MDSIIDPFQVWPLIGQDELDHQVEALAYLEQNPETMTFAAAIMAARLHLRLSHLKLAQSAQLNPIFVAALEAGVLDPSQITRPVIVRLLSVLYKPSWDGSGIFDGRLWPSEVPWIGDDSKAWNVAGKDNLVQVSLGMRDLWGCAYALYRYRQNEDEDSGYSPELRSLQFDWAGKRWWLYSTIHYNQWRDWSLSFRIFPEVGEYANSPIRRVRVRFHLIGGKVDWRPGIELRFSSGPTTAFAGSAENLNSFFDPFKLEDIEFELD